MKAIMTLAFALVTSLAAAQVGPVVGGDNTGTPGHCTDMPGDSACQTVTAPEPGTLALLAVGAGAALLARRRRES
jgi:hypothetical protein